MVLAIFVFTNLFILLSGKTYLYNGILKTYLVGKTGPGIYDLDVFPTNTIEKSNERFSWRVFAAQPSLSQENENFHQMMKTKAFLVIKDDNIVYEKYWENHSIETVSNSFSMAKTIVSLLLGIALEEGKIKSIDEKVSNYLPSFHRNSRNEISIRHLLTMSGGFDWEESGINPLSETAEAYYGTNLKRLVTTQRVVENPGKVFHYQSGNTQLLSMIIEKATGMTISKYAESKLWKKIGAESNAYWSLDDEGGDEKAFCCFYATARDFAKLGRLVLNKGIWKGEQVVSEKYITEMSSPAMELITEDGLTNLVYGYQIWIYNQNNNPVLYFRGLLGQYIFILPNENTIIVRLGEKIEPNFKPHRFVIFPEKINKYDHLVGHSTDILKYLEMKDEILKEITVK